MISPSSLQAFSPGITTGQSATQSAGVQATRIAAAANTASAPVQKTLQALPSGGPSGRPAPRGSLLDLSV